MLDYSLALMALWVILVTLLVQGLVAGFTKARQPGAVPGKIDDSLSHESFVFRSHRAFMNSLENIPLLLGTVMLAIFAGTNPQWTAVCLWLYALARLVHMLLYYAIATEKNPSPRSYFYGLALMANVVLLVLVALQWVS